MTQRKVDALRRMRMVIDIVTIASMMAAKLLAAVWNRIEGAGAPVEMAKPAKRNSAAEHVAARARMGIMCC